MSDLLRAWPAVVATIAVASLPACTLGLEWNRDTFAPGADAAAIDVTAADAQLPDGSVTDATVDAVVDVAPDRGPDPSCGGGCPSSMVCCNGACRACCDDRNCRGSADRCCNGVCRECCTDSQCDSPERCCSGSNVCRRGC